MINVLTHRAGALAEIRKYFSQNYALEVDTPLLKSHTVTDPYMRALQAVNPDGKFSGYLQTSPEYSMKELLSEGSGDIYQLGKTFRADESGNHHAIEFTMLEWYRISWSYQQLMDEVHQIIELIAGERSREDFTYRQAFLEFLEIDPFDIDEITLREFSINKMGALPEDLNFDNYLTLLFSELIEPQFSPEKVTFVYDFPVSQASLAKRKPDSSPQVACRFEAYCGGLEIANGFEELTDPVEQLARFNEDNQIRKSLGYPEQKIDMQLIDALKRGLPECSGVALGFDRILMLAMSKQNIKDILPMSFSSDKY